MAIFRFRYETLLGHRRRIEDQRQRDLAMHMRSRMIFQRQLQDMQDTIRTSKQDMADALVGAVDVSRVGRFAGYSQQTENRGRQIVQKLAQVEWDVQQAREKLLEATRARKALELLQEKDQKQWQRDQDRRERDALDEMAAQQYMRDHAWEVKA